MASSIQAGDFRASTVDETGLREALGVVSIAEDGRLTLLEAEPEHDAELTDVIDYVNGKTSFNVEAPPPEDAPPHAIVTREVRRGAPEFIIALADYIERYYGVELQPLAGPDALYPDLPAGNYRDDPYQANLVVVPPPEPLIDEAGPPPPAPREP